jgi:hypothetical protein
MRTLKEPRWQDWEYEYRYQQGAGDDEKQVSGMFGYLGDGWTEAEKLGGKVTAYLDEIDFPEASGVASREGA